MKHSTKAVLLSALIFPGLGQLLLKYYKTGISIVIVAFVCVVTVVTQAVSKALGIIEHIQQNGGVADAVSIANSIDIVGQNYDSLLINLAMLGLILCWLVSVIHAYVAGRSRDAELGSRDSNQ